MSVPFLESATGDPTLSQRRITGQQILGTPPSHEAAWRDLCQNGGPIPITIGNVDRLCIGSSGTLPGKKNIDPFTWELGDVNPVDYGQLWTLTNLFGYYENADVTTYRRWTWSRSQATVADPYIALQNDSDVVPRTTFYDGIVTGLTIAAAPNGNFTITPEILIGGHHFMGDVAQTAGAASTHPVFKGMLLDSSDVNQAWEETSVDYFLKVISNTAGALVLEGHIDTPTFTGTFTFPYTIGDDPVICLDENGDRVGKLSDPLRVSFPTGATVSASDEFQVEARLDRWTQTLPVDRAIPTINTSLIIDGVTTRIENGWSITIAWETSELLVDTSGAQGGTPRRSGRFTATFEIDRELVNLDLQKALYNATTLAFVIEGETDEKISGAGRPYLFRGIFPACQPEGSIYDVEAGATNRNEAITLRANDPDSAYEWPVGSGLMYSDAANVVYENDVAAL